MREILYRGKTEAMSGAKYWFYGSLVTYPHKGGAEIYKEPILDAVTGEHFTEVRTVDLDTVGQYTGFQDKNRVKIFEGDIVSFERVNALGYITSRIGDVRRFDKLPIFYIMATTGDAWDLCNCESATVIGNIHDNPELR